MVKSQLANEVNYKESKEIEEEDDEYSAPIYNYKLYDKEIEIGLGNPKHTFSRYGIVYFPVYLIVNNELIAKIGIFEIKDSELIHTLDDDGDVKLDKNKILFFISKDYLNQVITPSRIENSRGNVTLPCVPTESPPEGCDLNRQRCKDNVEPSPPIPDPVEALSKDDIIEIDDIDDVAVLVIPPEKKSVTTEIAEKTLKDGIFEEVSTVKVLPLLPEESKEQSDQIKKEFQESSRNNWMQNFRRNLHYQIVDNEGGGDCFFAVIRDAFKQMGKETTVEKLRALLANEATEEMFEQSRMLYTATLAEVQEKEREMKEIKKTIDQLKRRIEKAKGTNQAEEADVLKTVKGELAKYNQAKLEKKQATELLKEFAHMEGVDTLEKFRQFILTSNYWADTWAISTLERVLNIKVVVLSKEAYEAGDMDSVMKCGQLNDSELEKRGVFDPDYYIMTSYTGNHYTLVTYKEKRIFKFGELPYDIKIMVITKCLEKNAGPYYLIKDFRNLKTKLGLSEDEGKPLVPEDDYLNTDLYDKKTVFMFHQFSDAHPKAGKGSGETTDNLLKYKQLNSIKDWRKMLDDTWAAPFTVDGNKWNSVAHYYMAAQFKKGFPDYALKYAIESNSPISTSVKAAKEEYTNTLKTKKSLLQPDVKLATDPDFFTIRENPIFESERKKALEAKFGQNLDLKKTLLETQQAKLVHFERGKDPVPDTLLMRLRREVIP
jgi:predicted NAD-dependent protein-ADP-ribosyltransferase YbiA (DUF1768 family)